MRAILLLLFGFSFFLLNAFAEDTAVPGLGFRFGSGFTQPNNEALNSTLEGLGLGTIDPATLIPLEWGYGLTVGGLSIDLVGAQTANNTWVPLSGDHRTRFVWNSTELTFGTRFEFTKDLFLQAGAGVGVAKFLLQTYSGTASTFQAAVGQTGQVNLVSSWNWTPVATARVAWRFLKIPNQALGLTLGFGATAGANLFDSLWKLNDDVQVSGLGKPWDSTLRYEAWVGFE